MGKIWDWITVRLYALIHVKRYRDKILAVYILFASSAVVVAEIYKIIAGIKIQPISILCIAVAGAILITSTIMILKGEWE